MKRRKFLQLTGAAALAPAAALAAPKQNKVVGAKHMADNTVGGPPWKHQADIKTAFGDVERTWERVNINADYGRCSLCGLQATGLEIVEQSYKCDKCNPHITLHLPNIQHVRLTDFAK